MDGQQCHVDIDADRIEHRLSLSDLDSAQEQQSNLLAQMRDHLLHATKTIVIPPWDGRYENTVNSFFSIACALLDRSDRFQIAEDIKYSIQYLLYLRDSKLPLETCNLSRIQVTEMLVVALATHIEIEGRCETQIIEEMIRFCYELLAWEISVDYPVDAFVALGRAIHTEQMQAIHSETKSLDRVIDCLRSAVKKYPPQVQQVHQIHLDLAIALQFRMMRTRTASDNDYMEAIFLLNGLIDSSRLGHIQIPSPYSDEVSIIIARLTALQCDAVDRLEYTQEAISRCQSRIRYPFLRDESILTFNLLLRWLTDKRSKQLDLIEFLQREPSGGFTVLISSNKHLRHPTTTSTGPVFTDWKDPSNIPIDEGILSMTPAELSKEWMKVSSTAFAASSKASNTGDIVHIEEAIKYLRLATTTVPSPSRPISHSQLSSLGQLLYKAFNINGRVEYLEESISVDRRTLEINRSDSLRAEALRRLPASLIDRWRLLGHKKDLDESMHLFHKTSDDQSAIILERLEKAYFWASHARDSGHPSVLIAYQRAMSFMQSFATFAPTLEIQHAHLVSKENISKTPLEFASYLIHIGRLEQAVETLEHGRALLWSEMRRIRTSTDQLRKTRPALADLLAKINQKLENLSTSILQTADHRNREGDEFGRIIIEQRLALEERDALVSHVRGIPGFENFLKAHSSTLSAPLKTRDQSSL